MQTVAVAGVFVVTIGALYLRPFGARDWHIAFLGAATAWAVGPLGWRGGLQAVGDSANLVAFFLGLMLVAAGAEAAGLYQHAMSFLQRPARNERMLLLVLIVGAAITTVLSNDATPLILTPAVLLGAQPGGRRRTAAFGVTLIADGASLILPVSNPVNLLFVDRFHISFREYVTTITPAALAGVAALVLVILVQASRTLTTAPGAPAGPRTSPRATSTMLPLAAVGCLAAAYIVGGFAGVPLGAVTIAGGVLIAVAARAGGNGDWTRYRTHIAPGVLVFVSSLLLLVASVSAAGVLDRLTNGLIRLEGQSPLVTIVGAAVLAAVLANLINNWPSALVVAAAIGASPGPHVALVAGSLIGSTIGADFTLVGSLSTVFWLSLARQRAEMVSPWQYARQAFFPTGVALVAACLVAAILV